jgi:hypothetical protein
MEELNKQLFLSINQYFFSQCLFLLKYKLIKLNDIIINIWNIIFQK